MQHPTPEDWERAAQQIDEALSIHRQHLDAARTALAANDNEKVREVLAALLGGDRDRRA